jgi:catechol 2,3-dioxygenase-like lactoylglutathione lyase family enzyme
MVVLTTLRLPLAWEEFDLPNPLRAGDTVLTTGEIGWAWSGDAPQFGVPSIPAVPGSPHAGWGLDHVVLLVPDLEAAVATMQARGSAPRLRLDVRGRPTAFFRVGPILEVIESPVRAAAIFGVALVTDEALEVVALRWRARGLEVTDPRPALQPGRRILSVRGTEAGLAVMSPDRAYTPKMS